MNHVTRPCPDCGNELIDTRRAVQPYNDLDDYTGYRCSKCKRTFTDSEVHDISDNQHGRKP